MDVFARVVVGVDGTSWGLQALGQTLALAPPDAAAEDDPDRMRNLRNRSADRPMPPIMASAKIAVT